MKVILDIPHSLIRLLVKKADEETQKVNDRCIALANKLHTNPVGVPDLNIDDIINRAIIAYVNCEENSLNYLIDEDERARVDGLLEGEGYQKMTVKKM